MNKLNLLGFVNLNSLKKGEEDSTSKKEDKQKDTSKGVYANTSQNKKLGRVGKSYKQGDKVSIKAEYHSPGQTEDTHNIKIGDDIKEIHKDSLSPNKESTKGSNSSNLSKEEITKRNMSFINNFIDNADWLDDKFDEIGEFTGNPEEINKKINKEVSEKFNISEEDANKILNRIGEISENENPDASTKEIIKGYKIKIFSGVKSTKPYINNTTKEENNSPLGMKEKLSIMKSDLKDLFSKLKPGERLNKEEYFSFKTKLASKLGVPDDENLHNALYSLAEEIGREKTKSNNLNSKKK